MPFGGQEALRAMMMRPQLAKAFAEVDRMAKTAAEKIEKKRRSEAQIHRENLSARLHLAMDARGVEKTHAARKRWLMEQAATKGMVIDERTADRLLNAKSRGVDDTLEALDAIFNDNTKTWRLSATPPSQQQASRATSGTQLLKAARDYTPTQIGMKAEQLASQSGEDRVAIAMLLAFWEASAEWSQVNQVGTPS